MVYSRKRSPSIEWIVAELQRVNHEIVEEYRRHDDKLRTLAARQAELRRQYWQHDGTTVASSVRCS